MHSSASLESLSPRRSGELNTADLSPETKALPHPMHTLSPSESSTLTYASTVNLVEKPTAEKPTFWAKLGCGRRKATRGPGVVESQTPVDGGNQKLELFKGWRLVFLGSWLNILILLIPATWILKLSVPDSHTLIFAACLVAMIPLVKTHDMSVRDLSMRLGGARTGLLNASLSNIVEIVVAFIALRKCELRVVQSSLIGSMMSKILLILGMCFFAGGMRFVQQDFDPTATQIHSSLLSLSIGAMLLPAAFHFTLSYRPGEDAQTTLAEQKKDILQMSRGVSVVLICIYIGYIVFQFWSHSHHFKDAEVPSDRLPNSVSMRSLVRPATPMFRKLGSPTPSFPTVFRSPRSQPVLQKGPYMYRPTFNESPPRGVYGAAIGSQTSLVSPVPPPATSTVRLVPDIDRGSPDEADLMKVGGPRSPSLSPGRPAGAGERSSVLSEFVSSYFVEPYPVDEKAEDRAFRFPNRSQAHVRMEEEPMSPGKDQKEVIREPQLSWFLTLTVLTVVTVLVAINAEWMIDSLDPLESSISKEWIALILLPSVGSIAEMITAAKASAKDQLTLSIGVAVGSTIQTALFVIPLMILLGWGFNKPLALLFDPFESIVLYISVHTMGYVVADGKSNWLEGLILIGLYIVAAVSFWFYPGSNFSSTLAVCSTSP